MNRRPRMPNRWETGIGGFIAGLILLALIGAAVGIVKRFFGS